MSGLEKTRPAALTAQVLSGWQTRSWRVREKRPSLHRAFTTIRVSELPHYITAILQQFKFRATGAIWVALSYCTDETLGGRNGPATIASGIITSKYFSHLTHLTD
jgi:hypothetical protein